MTLQDWSAVATIVIVFITFFANKHIKSLSEYSSRQSDRKIVEDIFAIQTEAEREFTKDADFKTLHSMIRLTRAREIARLYKLEHIRLHLQKIIKAFGQGHVIYTRIWDENGNCLANHTSEDMDEYHRIVRDVYSYFDDIACYQNYLHVKDS